MSGTGSADHVDVLVVGAGPIGLDLACRLLEAGISCRLLEKRTEPTRHSRSIGIHPPALESLAEIGVDDELLRHGIRIREGLAFSNRTKIGTLRLDTGPRPFQFVLAIPQFETERILEDRLRSLGAGVLHRGMQVASIAQDRSGVTATTRDGTLMHCTYLVGADGPDSTVRSSLGLAWNGALYRDRFMMGDFNDGTDFGPTAAIFLTSRGLVESFPLPGGLRRWVARTSPDSSGDPVASPPLAGEICQLVEQRTGIQVDASSARMTSRFRVQRYQASSMAAGRVLLAGDAAHVISPIGGQGMNLGWLDNRAAAPVLVESLKYPERQEGLFRQYAAQRAFLAKRAARRAEFNMMFGRPGPLSPLVRWTARTMLKPPLAKFFAGQFTMRGF